MTNKDLEHLGKAECILSCLLPQVSSSVQAGFASAADEHIERHLDLNELVIKHPTATFFVRVQGDSMEDAAIRSGDILVVDRALTPTNGKIVVAVIDGEFTVKKLSITKEGPSLVACNAKYKKQQIHPETDFRIWGVVTYVISAR